VSLREWFVGKKALGEHTVRERRDASLFYGQMGKEKRGIKKEGRSCKKKGKRVERSKSGYAGTRDQKNNG